MEKPSYKVVGAPCGQHGQYTFYKAIKLTGLLERIVAIGDFFFVKIWQDSELISIGELQLLWTDRVSDQTLVSLRLYFLPENTPDGRGQHGEHEVLAINDKVVVRAEDLLSWVCVGREWRWGLRAVWRGDCAPPAPAAAAPAAPHSAPLHHTRLDFSDVEKEKSAITIDEEAPGVVVFSYPRYCRYRALVARLEGIQASWLRDSLVAALGGYAAPTRNTRILYCKDTFEYPELEGHEFVCNHLSPKLKGRPRGRRRRAADRSPGRSPRSPRSPARSDSRSSDSDGRHTPDNKTHRRLSLRNGPDKEESAGNGPARPSGEDEGFMSQLIDFYRDKSDTLKIAHTLKHMSLRLIYLGVVSRGGYEAVCRDKLWRHLYADLGPRVRRLYERCLLPFENHERRLSKKYAKGLNGKVEEKIDTIEVGDSPLREDKRLRTPSPCPAPHLDNETGEVLKDELTISKPAEELNREFLDSLPEPEKPAKISVKPVEKLIEPGGLRDGALAAHELRDKLPEDERRDGFYHDAPKYMGNSDAGAAWRGPPARAPLADLGPLAALTDNHNGHAQKSRPAGRSSLRAVRVKPARPPPQPAPATAQSAPTSSGRTGPSPPNNFGIHHPPPPAQPPAHHAPPHSDDDIVEVPYRPKSPEIIDLDEYPESPQAVKRKKLDILKERGLEVTAVPPAWGAVPLPGAVPLLPGPLLHPLLAPAQLYQMYNILPPAYPNGAQAPKVIQAVSAFGTAGPEKTVYGNPKDPFMPPPHVLGCAPLRPRPLSPPARDVLDVLDLTCPPPEPRAPAVEIVRVPHAPSPAASPAAAAAQNLAKNYTLLDGKAVVGSNLEITLVDPKAQTPPKRPPQKRNSNGKFAAKTPTPPKDYKYPPASPSGKRAAAPAVPYPARDESPTSSTGSRDSASSGYLNAFKAPGAALPFDPLYVSSLYGGLGQMDHRQLAMYRDFVASQFRGYSGLLNIGPPTTKN